LIERSQPSKLRHHTEAIPLVNPQTKRVEWALKHKDWMIKDWAKVIWSDEALIRIGHDSHHR